jgi:hypothetical protein
MQNITKFTFSGLSFKDYINNIDSGLNDEFRKIVDTYILQKMERHPSIHLNIRKIQLRHPIFRLLTLNALKFIMDKAYLLKMKQG